MKKLLIFFAGVVLAPSGAFAQESADAVDECQSDSDCPEQFVCSTVPMPCEATPCACACEPCSEDDDGCGCVCPVCEVAECTGVELRMCTWEPSGCASDEDCPDGFECVAEEFCSGGGCACPPCPCDPSSDVPCDCSDYECDCGDTSEPECELGESYCVPRKIQCVDAEDCAEGFECVPFAADTVCACPDCACMPCEGDACLPCECEPCECADGGAVEQELYCLPAQWSEYVDFEGGEMVLEPRQEGDAVVLDDSESGSAAPNGESEGDGDSGDCSAAASGTLSVVLLIPFFVIGLIRRRISA